MGPRFLRSGLGAPAVVLAALLLCAVVAGGTTILVDVEGGGDYLSIGQAMAAAAEGDTILIAPGIYTGPDNRGLDPAGKTLTIIGLAGPDSTTIDCESEDRAFWIWGGVGPAFLIEGLAIQNGQGDYGGALWCHASSPTFRSCVFRECWASSSGGAIRCSLSGASFQDCRFIGNHSESEGGALFVSDGSDVTLANVLFEGNHAGGSGGALRTASGASTTLEDVAFSGNTAQVWGGAMVCYGEGTHALTSVLFAHNAAVSQGGGALCVGLNSAVSVDGCTFAMNESSQGSAVAMSAGGGTLDVIRAIIAFGLGGAPVGSYGRPTFTHCCVYGNAVTDSLWGDYHDNIFWNPAFCGADADDFTLYDLSPCLPANNPWGELIGAYGQGCIHPGPLDPPDGLSVTTDDAAAFVRWRAVTDPDLCCYRIERDTTAFFGGGTAEFTTPDTVLVDAPLENWREYFYRAFAVDDVGVASAPGETVSVVVHPTPPGPPSGVSAAGLDTAAVLTWLPGPEADVDHYIVYRDTSSGAPPGAPHTVVSDTTFTDTGLTNYTSYYYRVTAVDTGDLEGDPSGEVRAVPHGIPPAVTGLRAVPGDSSAFLDWDAVTPPYEDFYRICRDTVPCMLSRPLLTDGFESYDPGGPPADPPWSVIEQTGTSALVTDLFAGEGTQSLALVDSSFAHSRIFHSLGDTSEPSARIKFLIRPGPVMPETNLLQCELFGERGIGYQAGLLEVRDGALAHWVNRSGTVTIASIDPGVWHEIDWRLDCVADTYGVWLDGEHVLEGAPFYNEARYLDVLQFRTRNSEWSRNWIDDVLWLGHVEHFATTPDTAYVDEPLESGRTYYYQVTVVDTFGTEGRLCEAVPVEPGWVGVDDEVREPQLGPALSRSSPNPFGSAAALSYTVPAPGADVTVRVYDVAGRLVKTLVEGHVEGGIYRLVWRGRDQGGRAVASGVYFCRVAIGPWSETRKLVLVR